MPTLPSPLEFLYVYIAQLTWWFHIHTEYNTGKAPPGWEGAPTAVAPSEGQHNLLSRKLKCLLGTLHGLPPFIGVILPGDASRALTAN